MIISTIIGIGVALFLFIFLFFKLNEGNDTPHFLLQILLLGVIMGLLLLLGKSVMENNADCDYLVNTTTDTYNYMCYGCTGESVPSLAGNTSLISSIVKVNEYSYVCEDMNDTGNIFYTLLVGFVTIFILYLFVFTMYQVGVYLKIWKPRKKKGGDNEEY